ncbi:MAG: sigma 54-interacting transcriptional regulator [Crocinitomicaceae bacterium]|nr:sigma 54-interacting transcriptional regulator [Crocinitomicaceae bacterium]
MDNTKIKTFGELKKAGYTHQPIKDELRKNLLEKLSKKEDIFPEFWGYEDTVVPQVERAILSKHNINFLGLRGQAKTKMARALTRLMDEYIPVVEGSEINDDPFSPISKYAVDLLAEKGDDTPISWVHRDERFFEKLATPDVTVADLIGDIDPIKAATLKLSYSDERVLHYGMIPRANRSIFVINELPDLQARIQVSLFNILQEGDIQIRGFKLRMPLDLQFIFTANPEDYTNRGSIVTPLKDRIGSQIITHYPKSIEIAKEITSQESTKLDEKSVGIHVPELAKDLIEQISFEARKSDYVDVKSGVSARTSITAYENLLSTAELRAIMAGEKSTAIRLSDFVGIIPAITGKVELVYEGEQEGAERVAAILLNDAIKSLFVKYYPEIKKLERQATVSPYQDILDWFYNNDSFELLDEFSDAEYQKELTKIKPLDNLVATYQPEIAKDDLNFAKEFVLWALVEYKKLSKQRTDEGYEYLDRMKSF